jgi:hypothetical protein
MYFLDEWAFVERQEAVDAAISQNTNVHIKGSTRMVLVISSIKIDLVDAIQFLRWLGEITQIKIGLFTITES